VSKHGQVPNVGKDLGLGAGQRPACMGGQGVHHTLEGQTCLFGWNVVSQGPHLLAAQVINDGAQVGLLGAHPTNSAALLQPNQYLQDHPGREATQTDLSAAADRRIQQAPPGLVETRLGPPRSTQS
jgi:hypothetical protein